MAASTEAPPAAPPAVPPEPAGPPAAPSGEVVVQGQKASREVTRHVLSREEIRTLPGSNGDALRALENLPGVARSPDGTGQLVVRGAAPGDTAVFVDGTRIPLIYHLGGISSVVPSEALARLDFYPGNYGPEYGRALGGVVDLGLRTPRRDRIGGLAQVDLVDARALAEGPITDRLRFLVAGRRSWVDAWIKPVIELSGNNVTAAPVYYDGQAILEYDLSPTTRARLALFGASDKFVLIFTSPLASDPVPGALGVGVSFWRLQGRVESKLGALTAGAMLSYGREIRDLTVGPNFVEIDAGILNARADLRWKPDRRLALVAGIDNEVSAAQVSVKIPPSGVEGGGVAPTFGRTSPTINVTATAYQPAAYALAEITPGGGLRLLPGFRLDWTRETQRWNSSPRLAVRWVIPGGAPATTLKGGVGLYYQPPEPGQSIPPTGTGGLRNNRAIQSALGLEQGVTDALSLSVEGFYRDLRDLVTQVNDPAGTATGVGYTNQGLGRTVGVEFLLRYRRIDRLTAWVSYTISRSERRDAPGAPQHLYTYDQPHILSALASYALGRGWEAGARLRLASGNPTTPARGGVVDLDAGAYESIPGRIFSARDATFWRLDLRVEKAWVFSSWKLTAYLDVQNATNRANAEGVQYSYNYTQQKPNTGLPLLPVLGARGEL